MPYYIIAIITNIILALSAIGGAIAVVLQLKRNESLKEAEFIVDFNTQFGQHNELLEVYNRCAMEAGYAIDSKIESFDYTKVIAYLNYFEPLYFLLENKAIHIDKISSLAGNRFFVVACNRDVQEKVIRQHQRDLAAFIELYKRLKTHRYRNEEPPEWLVKNDLVKFLEEKSEDEQ